MGAVNNVRLMVKVCEMYYLQNLSQKEISSRLSISRPQISRILAQARSSGLVTIKINNPYSRESRMEQQLIQRYDLSDALVVDSGEGDSHSRMKSFARQVAGHIDTCFGGGSLLGVMSGHTVSAIIDAMRPMSRKLKAVVPLVGGIGAEQVEIHANSIAQRMAQRCATSALSLNAPAVITEQKAAEFLRKEPAVAKVLEMGRSCDVALVGIGSVSMEATNVRAGGLTEEDIRYLKSQGAKASVCCSYIDERGQEVGQELMERSVGQSLHSLKTSRIVAAAIGDSKTEAVQAALSTGRIHTFVTDITTAQRLLNKS